MAYSHTVPTRHIYLTPKLTQGLLLKNLRLLCVCSASARGLLWVYPGQLLGSTKHVSTEVWSRPIFVSYTACKPALVYNPNTLVKAFGHFSIAIMLWFWNRGLLSGSGSEIEVCLLCPLWVYSGSAWGLLWGRLWVRHSRPEADPERTQKSDLGFGWGLLSARLGLDSTF